MARPSIAAGAGPRRRLGRTLAGPRWNEYRRLLQAAIAQGYEVVSLEDWLAAGAPDGERPLLVLRHDVDQHPRSVKPMLAAERELGLTSTWYFRWRTADAKQIAAVRAAGGAVGLHYETLTRRVLENGRGPDDAPPELLEDCRAELRVELEAFERLFGPTRSACPHGDSRVPGVSNQPLLRDVDLAGFGLALDGNDGLRGRRLGAWLTDRSAPDGRWSDGLDPMQLLRERRTPILCVTHPNNFASGPGLWADRLLAAALPRPAAARRRLIGRTGSDRPPAVPPGDARVAPVADALEREVRRHFEEKGRPLTGAAGLNTLYTNSRFAERRADGLLAALARHGGPADVSGLRVVDAGCGFGALALVLAARGARVTGFDPNAERLTVGRAVAAEHGLDAVFQRGRTQTAELPDDRFDLAVLNNSLCYVVDRAERRQALANVLRILRPGGWLVMRNPNRVFPVDQFTGRPLLNALPPAAAARAARALGLERSHVRLLSPWQARRELASAGFDRVSVAPPPFARYQHVVARRPPAVTP